MTLFWFAFVVVYCLRRWRCGVVVVSMMLLRSIVCNTNHTKTVKNSTCILYLVSFFVNQSSSFDGMDGVLLVHWWMDGSKSPLQPVRRTYMYTVLLPLPSLHKFRYNSYKPHNNMYKDIVRMMRTLAWYPDWCVFELSALCVKNAAFCLIYSRKT